MEGRRGGVWRVAGSKKSGDVGEELVCLGRCSYCRQGDGSGCWLLWERRLARPGSCRGRDPGLQNHLQTTQLPVCGGLSTLTPQTSFCDGIISLGGRARLQSFPWSCTCRLALGQSLSTGRQGSADWQAGDGPWAPGTPPSLLRHARPPPRPCSSLTPMTPSQHRPPTSTDQKRKRHLVLHDPIPRHRLNHLDQLKRRLNSNILKPRLR